MNALRAIKRGVVRRRMADNGINHKAMSRVWQDKKFMKKLIKKGVR